MNEFVCRSPTQAWAYSRLSLILGRVSCANSAKKPVIVKPATPGTKIEVGDSRLITSFFHPVSSILSTPGVLEGEVSLSQDSDKASSTSLQKKRVLDVDSILNPVAFGAKTSPRECGQSTCIGPTIDLTED